MEGPRRPGPRGPGTLIVRVPYHRINGGRNPPETRPGGFGGCEYKEGIEARGIEASRLMPEVSNSCCQAGDGVLVAEVEGFLVALAAAGVHDALHARVD